jgi:2-aminoethylphosphonate-pyruvate transaminase
MGWALIIWIHTYHPRKLSDFPSSFGAVPLDLSNVDYLVSSANKCLEGVPGKKMNETKLKTKEIYPAPTQGAS